MVAVAVAVSVKPSTLSMQAVVMAVVVLVPMKSCILCQEMILSQVVMGVLPQCK